MGSRDLTVLARSGLARASSLYVWCLYMWRRPRIAFGKAGRAIASSAETAEGFVYKSAGPMTLTISDPEALSFASVVSSRHLNNRARARYSAS